MNIKVKTREGASPNGKPRVYFCCHKDDFDLYFEKITNDILKTHDCAIYYTADMEEPFDKINIETDLESNNLFVVPVTEKLLKEKNRAMDFDIAFAKKKKLPLLPFMMEKDIVSLYSKKNKFGDIQYLDPNESDITAISHKEKLKKYLDAVLVSEETAKRVRAAFDAYVFLSYRKKDRRYANELMRLIHENEEFRDIAIWYDEFLTPGESFKDNIDKILQDSKLFALLVTPSLLEEPNYVMDNEYPAAKASKMDILPTEMEKTDKNALKSKYKDIPECIDPRNNAELRRLMTASLKKVAIAKNNSDPEHNYLIGLAYLDGIDIEVNRKRGVELITSAANDGLPEAMVKLYRMYSLGEHLPIDHKRAAFWGEKLYNLFDDNFGSENQGTLMAMNILAMALGNSGDRKKEERLLRRTYALQCKTLGEDHDNTLTTLTALAANLSEQGKLEEAEEIGEKLYKKYCELFGEEHDDTLAVANNLAITYAKLNKTDEAVALGEKTHAALCRLHGNDAPNTLITLLNLSTIYNAKGDHSKALSIQEKMYSKLSASLGESHSLTSQTEQSIIQTTLYLKRVKTATELAKKSYNKFLMISGAEHPDTVSAKKTLKTANNILRYFKRKVKCEILLYRLYRLIFGRHHKTIRKAADIGYLFEYIEDFNSSYKYCKLIYEHYCETDGENSPTVRATADKLNELKEKAGHSK